MRIEKEIAKNIEEKFNPKDLPVHYKDHVTETGFNKEKNSEGVTTYSFTTYEMPDEEAYDEAADNFARADIKDSDIEGFIGPKGRFYKRNVLTGEFTVYSVKNGDPINITYYIIKDSAWRHKKTALYVRDIKPDEDAKPKRR